MGNFSETQVLLKGMLPADDSCVEWPFRTDQWGQPSVMMPYSEKYGHMPRGDTAAIKRSRTYSAKVVVLVEGGVPYKGHTHHPVNSCGNKKCISLRHLSFAKRGAGQEKLTPEQKAEIKASPKRREQLAVDYNVSIGTIDRALKS